MSGEWQSIYNELVSRIAAVTLGDGILILVEVALVAVAIAVILRRKPRSK
jgi:hypothetical protein